MTHLSLVVCPEWKYKGFANLIHTTCFHETSQIVGLSFLRKNLPTLTRQIKDQMIDSVTIAFIDSLYEPLYQCIQQICSLIPKHTVIKVVVEPVPTHLCQKEQGFSIDAVMDFSPHLKEIHTLPRDSTVWDKTKQIRKLTYRESITPKVFPILTTPGNTKDFHYLRKIAKYNFSATLTPWDASVIDAIIRSKIVGIAASKKEDHEFFRKFWNTYGLLVLEDVTFPQPFPAHTIDFIELLSNKKYLSLSSRSNLEWKPDLEGDQARWRDLCKSMIPTQILPQSPSSVPVIHSKQKECPRYLQIPQAKLIQEKGNAKQARLPLPNIQPDSLPSISVCTLTRDHRVLFPFVVNSIHHQSYPLDKIEWIILQNGDEPIDDLISKKMKDKFKRVHIEVLPSDHGMSLGALRNKVVSLANEPYVAFMDDDDIQFHTSLLARVKSLIKYNADCVGCTTIGNYDLLQGKGGIASDGQHVFSEASMMFRKSFWEQRQFNDKEKLGEAHGFLMGRQQRCIGIPYHFVLLALVHGVNTTGTLRLIEGKELIPLKQLLSEHELSLVESTATYLRQRYKVVKSNK